MNILFTVCGRGGSKGVKNKNIRKFLGVPLFEYTLCAINEFKKNNGHKYDNIHVAVSTDSIDFINLVKQYESKDFFIINRKLDLAQDRTPKMHVIKDALENVEFITNVKYEIVVDLDITSPIRCLKDIENTISKKINNDIDVVFSVTDARRNPYFNMVKLENGYAKKVLDSNYTARQQAPTIFDMNASIYAYSREFLLSGVKSPLEGTAMIVEMLDTGIIDIDSENDFCLMEVVAKWLFKNKEEYKYLFLICEKE